MTDEVCRKYVTTLYNRFERTFVPSPVLAKLLTNWEVERIHTVDLGVDTEVFTPDIDDRAATRQKLGIPVDTRLLLYVGRLGPEKNVRTLFEAFSILHSREPGKYRLLCVGDGTQRALVQNLEAETQAVHWLPYCPDAGELAKLYRAADLFVHPGVQETFGLVALESQASGTAVVGIKGSYMDRIIFTDQKQWATENSPAALAEAIGRKFTQNLPAAGLAKEPTTASAAIPAVVPCSRKAVATAEMSARMLTKPRMPPDGTNTSSTITARPKTRSATTHRSVFMPSRSIPAVA
jgi:alpha-1,6-mannosyltransferase